MRSAIDGRLRPGKNTVLPEPESPGPSDLIPYVYVGLRQIRVRDGFQTQIGDLLDDYGQEVAFVRIQRLESGQRHTLQVGRL